MIQLLICLGLLSVLADAVLVDYSGSQILDISTCPITYWGKKYEKLYVEFLDVTFACFDNYRSNGGQYCLEMPFISSKTFRAEIGVNVTDYYEDVHNILDHIKNTPEQCAVQLQINFISTSEVNIFFINYGKQAAVHWWGNIRISTIVNLFFRVHANGDKISSFLYDNSGICEDYADLTGCQHNGSGYRIGGTATAPEICGIQTCDSSGEWKSSPQCPPHLVCLGNNTCSDAICTVIGPKYISFYGDVGDIPDFCSYILLSTTGFTITGYFNDRRLTDVPFLSKVVLTTTADISLTEGGKVSTVNSVDDVIVPTLSSKPVTHHGVALTKDDTGVTAVFKYSSDITFIVFYDGTILHITYQAVKGKSAPVGSACNTDSVLNYKDTNNSPAGCDVVTSTPEINCTATTAELDSCKMDPVPYQEVCKNLFCDYPKEDGLKCDILHAYARTCKMQDWAGSVSCPASVCPYHACAPDEFCAVKPTGEPACFCRARFSSKYRSLGTYGDPTVCVNNTASVSLYTCFLEEQSINYTALSLNDASCRGVEDPDTKTLTFSFSDTKSCGAILTAESNQTVVKNHITNIPSSIITREDQTTLTFSCAYTQPDVQSLTLKIAQNSFVKVLESSDFTFTLMMSAFTDAGLTQTVDSSTELALNQKIWVKLETKDVDTVKLALVIDDCWATSESSPTAVNRYDLIIDGCPSPSDGTVKVVSNGETEASTFSYNIFRFSSSPGDVYLHCQVHLCIKEAGCVPPCTKSARRRRSLAEFKSENPSLITMAWTN